MLTAFKRAIVSFQIEHIALSPACVVRCHAIDAMDIPPGFPPRASRDSVRAYLKALEHYCSAAALVAKYTESTQDWLGHAIHGRAVVELQCHAELLMWAVHG